MEDQRDPIERLSLQRLSPTLGAEVRGFDAGTLDTPALGPFLRRALVDHQLLQLRGVNLDPVNFRRLGARLGPLRRVPRGQQVEPGLPEVQHLSNLGALLRLLPGTPVLRLRQIFYKPGDLPLGFAETLRRMDRYERILEFERL